MVQLVLIQKITFGIIIGLFLGIAFHTFGLGDLLWAFLAFWKGIVLSLFFNPFEYMPSVSVSLNYPKDKSDL